MAEHNSNLPAGGNPFIHGDWEGASEGTGRLLSQLVQSLAGDGVVCHLDRLMALDPERFALVLEMLHWFYQHGPDDAGLGRLAVEIRRGENGDLFAATLPGKQSETASNG